jgi:hypothetical protein
MAEGEQQVKKIFTNALCTIRPNAVGVLGTNDRYCAMIAKVR